MPSFILDLFPDVLLDIIVGYILDDKDMHRRYLLERKNGKISRTITEIYIYKTYKLIFARSVDDIHLDVLKLHINFNTVIDDYARKEQIQKDSIILGNVYPHIWRRIIPLPDIKIDNKQCIKIIKQKLIKIE